LENNAITIERAKKNLDYAIDLYNCIHTPLDEKIIAFAEQDKTAKAYRDCAIQGLKGEDVSGYLHTYGNSALDRIYYWRRWIREYEEGFAIGKERGELRGKREIALNAIAMGLSTERIAKYTGLSEKEILELQLSHKK
jgi:predicted transposase/invertase (TIGR01784 family)